MVNYKNSHKVITKKLLMINYWSSVQVMELCEEDEDGGVVLRRAFKVEKFIFLNLFLSIYFFFLYSFNIL